MEIKVGQWWRINDELKQFKTEQYIENIKFQFGEYFENIKVANTPQELIEVGDLVFTPKTIMYNGLFDEEYLGKVDSVDEIEICCSGGCVIYTIEITKILTPNNQGGYDLQWEAQYEK